jgi:hypothetical protein
MHYDIKLRPHHVNAFIEFESKNLFHFSDKEYIKRFKEKNKGHHNQNFILYWKHFLDKLHKNSDLRFLYKNERDTVCSICDIKEECDNPETHLHELVNKLDFKALEKLHLKEGEVYSMSHLKEIISQN